MMLPVLLAAAVSLDLSAYRAGPVTAQQRDDTLVVSWSDEASRPWRGVFSLDPAAPLIRELGPVRSAVPLYSVTTGKRHGSWDAFFDHPGRRPAGARARGRSRKLTG